MKLLFFNVLEEMTQTCSYVNVYICVSLCFGFRFGFGGKLLERVTSGWVLQMWQRKTSGDGLMGPSPPICE